MKNFSKVVVLASAVVATPAVAEEWVNNFDFGLSLSKGNTDNSLLRMALQSKKKQENKTYSAELRYSYGEENGETNEDETYAKFKFKNDLSNQKFYGVRVDALRDQFADINYRFSFNLTYGHNWVNTPETLFSTEIGLGLTIEDKEDGSSEYLNGLFEQHYEHQFNEHAKVFQHLSFAPRLNNLSDYRIEFDAGVETKISESMAFKVSIEDRYESRPAEGKESNDLKFIAGISYKF